MLHFSFYYSSAKATAAVLLLVVEKYVLLRFEDGSHNLDTHWKFQGPFVILFLLIPLLCFPCMQTDRFPFPQDTLIS